MRISRILATEVVVPAHPGAIESAALRRPLHKLPVKGSRGWSVQFDELPKIVLQLELADGTVGLGELYRSVDWPTVDAIAESLVGEDIGRLCRQDLPFARTREYDGFEIAIWDAYARTLGVRVVDLLGGPVRDLVEVSAWSSHRTLDEIGDVARGYHEQGFTSFKLKCSLEDDVVGWCAAIAESAPGMRVVLDPNERFERVAEARRIADGLAEIGNVLCLEDPIPHWMAAEWAELRRATSIPVVRHVSLPYTSVGNRPSDAITAIRNSTVDGFNFNAGLADFQRLDHVADVAGLPSWHGSEVDLGILEAAYVHSAAAARSCTWPSDIFGRHIRSHDLLREPLALTPPHVRLPSGPGLGVELDDSAVAKFRTSEKEYRS
ncbi:mandelate racemase/muconate lactonizing enzyme family protein [Streptomyces luteolus]|uniref:glucarate dehydratase n=1 Tax=Streptomyces luteolus TaxID=3043615 RepID=A0ABT6ST35_9ACTN|nr:mandelate racemase/muconate lactonizing enzyme family protein [Streptomyces sp. B-S-A12]MDI3418736.1 mandelate racemase/muconate lactonizing enzyme family protein [Streptomyces sp. B-S-A12]